MEFFVSIRDREKYDKKLNELIYQPLAETIRMQTMHLFNVAVTKGRISDPRKLMRFPWDEEKEPQTKEQMKQVMKDIAAYYNAKEIVKKNSN